MPFKGFILAKKIVSFQWQSEERCRFFAIHKTLAVDLKLVVPPLKGVEASQFDINREYEVRMGKKRKHGSCFIFV